MSDETEIKAGSGDIRIRKEGKASEVTIPWGQYMRLMVAVGVLFAAGSAIVLLLEHWTFYFPIVAGVVWLVILAARAQDRMRRAATLISTMSLGIGWVIFGPRLCQDLWIFPAVTWPWQVRGYVILALLVVICTPTLWIIYRYTAEIVDPSGPTAPRKPVERSNTIWPWTNEPEGWGEGLTRDIIEELIRERIARDADTLRVEVKHGGDGNGGVRSGGGFTIDDLPHAREALPIAAKRWHAGQMRWSRRGLTSIVNIGDTKARQLLDALIEYGFLIYPDGNENHPDGAQPTAKGRAMLRGLLQ